MQKPLSDSIIASYSSSNTQSAYLTDIHQRSLNYGRALGAVAVGSDVMHYSYTAQRLIEARRKAAGGPFTCPECGSTFTRRVELLAHAHGHTPDGLAAAVANHAKETEQKDDRKDSKA